MNKQVGVTAGRKSDSWVANDGKLEPYIPVKEITNLVPAIVTMSMWVDIVDVYVNSPCLP
jgi:hypothetical protein